MDAPDQRKAMGARIRQLRKASGLSQGQLGEILGVTYQQIQKYEGGRSSISAAKLEKVCQAVGVSLDAFHRKERPEGLNLSEPASALEPVWLTEKERNLVYKLRAIKNNDVLDRIGELLQALDDGPRRARTKKAPDDE